ncbi:MFS transporter [Streptomyces rubiginosohelvolus]|uniref:MFS transporter n=1 Tax=Streptomyces rubiginosohelvolus TaxID=67362 RepID=UPI0036B741D4
MSTDASVKESPTPVRPLRELLSHRPYWVWTLITQLVNAPALMAAIAFAGLAAAGTGEAKDGGFMVASLILADVASSGIIGKVADRTSGRVVPVVSAALAAAGLASVVVAALADASLVALCALCVVAGLGLGGLTGLTRTLLNSVVPERLLERALAVNATAMEALVVLAPLIAGGAIFVFGWTGGVATMAVGAGLLALLLAFARGAARPASAVHMAEAAHPDSARKRREPLWNLGFIAWLMVGIAFSHTLGAIETGALPLAQKLEFGVLGGGSIIAVLAVSGITAGVGYAVFADRLPGGPSLRAGLLLTVVAAAAVGVGQAGTWTALTAMVVVAGVCTAPLNAIRSFAVEKVIPADRRAEGFGWLYTASSGGFAASGLGMSTLPLGVALSLPAITCLAAVCLLLAAATRRRPAV